MLSTQQIKTTYSNLYVDGYLFIHRAMIKSLQDLATVARQLERLSQEEVSKLADWYDFVYTMIEHHHQEEDDQTSPYSFVAMNRKSPIANLDQLQSDHHLLESYLAETKEKLRQLVTETDQAAHAALIDRLQYVTVQCERCLGEHLAREEEVILPVYNQYTKVDQVKLGKIMEKRMRQGTPKQYASYGLLWLVSGISEEERTGFFKTLPLPPILLMRFVWNKKYATFTSVINN